MSGALAVGLGLLAFRREIWVVRLKEWSLISRKGSPVLNFPDKRGPLREVPATN